MNQLEEELDKILEKWNVILHPSDIEMDIERKAYLKKDIQKLIEQERREARIKGKVEELEWQLEAWNRKCNLIRSYKDYWLQKGKDV